MFFKVFVSLTLVASQRTGDRQLGRYGGGSCSYGGEQKPVGSSWMIDGCIQATCVKEGNEFIIEQNDICPPDQTTTTSEPTIPCPCMNGGVCLKWDVYANELECQCMEGFKVINPLFF